MIPCFFSSIASKIYTKEQPSKLFSTSFTQKDHTNSEGYLFLKSSLPRLLQKEEKLVVEFSLRNSAMLC